MNSERKRYAVFLDRDGTLIEDRGHLASPSEVCFLPGVVEALHRLREDFLFFLVTNQSGVAEGMVTLEQVEQVNAHVTTALAEAGLKITATYVCPHHRGDGCKCIKPNPHFLHRAAEEHGVDLRRSFVVGDHPHDVELAKRAGAQGIYVCTGHGVKHLPELPAEDMVVPDLRAAAEWILSRWPPYRMRHGVGRAAGVLRRGGVVAFPTETVYGLGANAFDRIALERVFDIKKRPRFDPLIVHVADARQASCLVKDFPPAARELARRFWPGPLSLVLPKIDDIPDIVTAGHKSVAIRVPNHALALGLLWETGVAVAAPSANIFGGLSPTTANDVATQLGGDVDMILDGGPCSIGVESTIVSFCHERPTLLRPGGLPLEEIEEVIGPLALSTPADAVSLSPGRLPRHYAPRTPLLLKSDHNVHPGTGRIGLLCLKKPADASRFAVVEALSETGDLREAAANLFPALRRLDSQNVHTIVAFTPPESGFGRAIADRLRRASSSGTGSTTNAFTF